MISVEADGATDFSKCSWLSLNHRLCRVHCQFVFLHKTCSQGPLADKHKSEAWGGISRANTTSSSNVAATNLQGVKIWHVEPFRAVVLEHVVWLATAFRLGLVDNVVSNNTSSKRLLS